MSRLAEIEHDAWSRGVDVRSLPAAVRVALVRDALSRRTPPMPLPTPAQRAAVAAADVPAEADSPYYVGDLFVADPSLAAHQRALLAERQARDEARRRAALSAFPGQLDEVREALDAVAAQRWAEGEAA